jgi:uncharacterized membrane protein
MRKLLITAMLLLFFSQIAQGATIYGNIYDPVLKKVNNAVVEIDTNPKQKLLAINGTYQFSIPPGDYRITAQFLRGSVRLATEENITIIDDGFYILDLFLYTDLDTDYYFNDTDFDVSPPAFDSPRNYTLFAVLVMLIIASALTYYIRENTIIKKRQIEESNILDDDLKKILSLLRKNKGRLSQKDIGRHFAYTDAKISLMITELEDKKIVRRVKRGRSNIIFLNIK